MNTPACTLALAIGKAAADIVFAAIGIRSRPFAKPNPTLERVTNGR